MFYLLSTCLRLCWLRLLRQMHARKMARDDRSRSGLGWTHMSLGWTSPWHCTWSLQWCHLVIGCVSKILSSCLPLLLDCCCHTTISFLPSSHMRVVGDSRFPCFLRFTFKSQSGNIQSKQIPESRQTKYFHWKETSRNVIFNKIGLKISFLCRYLEF